MNPESSRSEPAPAPAPAPRSTAPASLLAPPAAVGAEATAGGDVVGDAGGESGTPPPGGPAKAVVVPHQLGGVRAAIAWLIYAVICVIGWTIRVRWATSRQSLPERLWGQVIICAWHNRTFFALPLYFWHYRRQQPDRRLAAMTSASKDGAIVARVFELFGATVARGSTSRRGRQALLELARMAARGYDLAITPDGPRGPCYTVQPGIIALAQVTGLPIAPVSYRLHWRIRLKSWDRFLIPIPFTRCDLIPGELIEVPREATPEQREAIRQRLEAQMRAITLD